MNDQPAEPRQVKTALYVDFDNIFIGLDQINPAAARRFASQPARWLNWIERGMPTGEAGRGAGRSVLMRRCYLNPRSFGHFRDSFTQAAFSIVDCPSLTGKGKNSTDIHMVMDVLDTLYRYPHFEEFIILSGDSDFTPVLLRLRAYDRRTAILSIGSPPSAYAAASDIVLGCGVFIRDGLGLKEPAAAAPAPRPAPAQPRPASPAPAPPAAPPLAPQPAPAAANSAGPAPEAAHGVRPPVAEMREQILGFIRQYLDDSTDAVQLITLANKAAEAFGRDAAATKWGGGGTFKGLLTANAGRGWVVQMTADHRHTYVFDPARHAIPEEIAAASPSRRAAPAGDPADDILRRVGRAAGVPVLAAEDYALVFRLLEGELRAGAFNGFRASQRMRDACASRGAAVSRKNLLAILKALGTADGAFAEAHSQSSAGDLARMFRRRVAELCVAAQLELATEEESLLDEWLLGADDVSAAGGNVGDGRSEPPAADPAEGPREAAATADVAELDLLEVAAGAPPPAPAATLDAPQDVFDPLDLEETFTTTTPGVAPTDG